MMEAGVGLQDVDVGVGLEIGRGRRMSADRELSV